jgi:hypothetical protein
LAFHRASTLARRLAAAVEMEYRRRMSDGVLGRGEPAPKQWNTWLTTMLPRHFNRPLGRRHREFWRWILSVRPGERPEPFIGVWPRGSGKSTSGEAGGLALGVRDRRPYGLYVSGTQDQADKHVETLAGMLEESTIARYYPKHSKRRVGKYGNAKGWRRNRVWTAGGFAVDALGLDVAARGIKLESDRPGFIILDDIDGQHDSLLVTAKKIETITHSILPAGSPDCAVLGIQNLILRTGFFTQLVDGELDVLVDRFLSGPFPAVEGLEWEWQRHQKTGLKHAVITKGTATWEGQPLKSCQELIDTIGIAAFVKECQHEVRKKGLGIVLRLQPANMIDLSDDDCRELLARKTGFGGVDFQAARFAFVLYATDQYGRAIRIDEYFSQFERLGKRAFVIHRMCQFYGVMGMLPIWGDAANPQDIMELNGHFRDGWDICLACNELWPRHDATRCAKCGAGEKDRGHETSKLRVLAVGQENKLRRPAVEKINDKMDHGLLLFRTGIEYDWMLGRTSSSEGKPMRCSRLLWESDNWSYPQMKPREAQDENPDDDTADGADFMAAQRYACMSHWRKAKLPQDFGFYEHDRAEPFDFKKRAFKEVPHAVDLITSPSGRRAPPVNAPRPRFGGRQR